MRRTLCQQRPGSRRSRRAERRTAARCGPGRATLLAPGHAPRRRGLACWRASGTTSREGGHEVRPPPQATPPRRFRLPFSPCPLVLVPAPLALIFPFFWLLVPSPQPPAEALHFPPILIPH